jgi:hypothetical protein
MASAVQVRNGPPDAVIHTISTSSMRDPASAWNTALCSESTGRMVHAPAGRRPHDEIAGRHQTFLVGEGHRRARLDRRQHRRDARRARDGGEDDVGGPAAAATTALFAGCGLDAGSRQRRLQRAIGVIVGDGREPRAVLPRDACETRRVASSPSRPRRETGRG